MEPLNKSRFCYCCVFLEGQQRVLGDNPGDRSDFGLLFELLLNYICLALSIPRSRENHALDPLSIKLTLLQL